MKLYRLFDGDGTHIGGDWGNTGAEAIERFRKTCGEKAVRAEREEEKIEEKEKAISRARREVDHMVWMD